MSQGGKAMVDSISSDFVGHVDAGLPPCAGPIAAASDDSEGAVAMVGGWLDEAERFLDEGDQASAATSLSYAVAALDALTVDTDVGTTISGLGSRLLGCYRAISPAGSVDLPAAPAFAATG